MRNCGLTYRLTKVVRVTKGALFLASFLLVSSSCKFLVKSKADLSDKGGDEASSQLGLLEEIDNRYERTLHPVVLDEANFKVKNLRVGEKTFLDHSTPVLEYDIPKDADYVEVLRCLHDVIINGGSYTIDYVELGSKNQMEETRIFQNNNFWKSALEVAGCEQLVSSYTDTTFEDPSAPTGKYYYYLRACIDKPRLIVKGVGDKNYCSRQVSRSTEYTHVNRRDQKSLETMKKRHNIQQQYNSLSLLIAEKNSYRNNLLAACERKHKKKLVSDQTRTAIGSILAAGPLIGAIAFGVFKLRKQQLKIKPFESLNSATNKQFSELNVELNSSQVKLLRTRLASKVDDLKAKGAKLPDENSEINIDDLEAEPSIPSSYKDLNNNQQLEMLDTFTQKYLTGDEIGKGVSKSALRYVLDVAGVPTKLKYRYFGIASMGLTAGSTGAVIYNIFQAASNSDFNDPSQCPEAAKLGQDLLELAFRMYELTEYSNGVLNIDLEDEAAISQ